MKPRPKKDLLRRLATEVLPGHHIVELGSYRGESAIALADGAGDGVRVTCIDLWTLGNTRVVSPAMARKIRANGYDSDAVFAEFQRRVGNRVNYVRAHSAEAARLWSRPIGLLHVDADHAYEAARADFDAWSPHVVDDGVIALDDVHPNYPGVQRLLSELLTDGWREVARAASLVAISRAS